MDTLGSVENGSINSDRIIILDAGAQYGKVSSVMTSLFVHSHWNL